MSALDPTRESTLDSYFATLTCSGGFSDDQASAIEVFHRTDYFVNVLLVSELHQTGELHFHSLFDCKTRAAGKVTQKFQRFYGSADIPFVSYVSVKIKSVTDKLGLFHYLTKDMLPDEKPLVLKGWIWTWIQEQCRDNIKRIPFKQLLRDCYFVNKKNGTEMILCYMKANKLRCQSKDDFKQIVHCMVRDRFRFSSSAIPWLYAEVSVMSDCGKPLASLLDNLLFHLD